MDETNPEYLKCLDVVGLSWLLHLFCNPMVVRGSSLVCQTGWWWRYLCYKGGPESVFQIQRAHTSHPPQEGLPQGTGQKNLADG